MNRYLLLSFFLFMFDLSSHAEFRVWRNTEGKSVTAEFKGMNDEKVILLREDGKEFLMSPDMLCEEDQVYIQEKLSTPAQDSSEGAEEEDVNQFISKTEANEIAEKYAEAIKNNDLVALKKLIWNSDDPERVWDPTKLYRGNPTMDLAYEIGEIENIWIKSIRREEYGYEIKMMFVIKRDGLIGEYFGYVQMLRGGKIKYDTFGLFHPYEYASGLILNALYCSARSNYYNPSEQSILELDIPLFGFEEAKRDSDKKRSIKKIGNWLKDEGEEWDETEPRVPCQKDVFEYWVEKLRSVEEG
ncbi:MAG: hypothetical protein JXR23_01480 [Pontiellaceae bacterium]|nr:hypothetical protein [Pontiellaceae bacterium]